MITGGRTGGEDGDPRLCSKMVKDVNVLVLWPSTDSLQFPRVNFHAQIAKTTVKKIKDQKLASALLCALWSNLERNLLNCFIASNRNVSFLVLFQHQTRLKLEQFSGTCGWKKVYKAHVKLNNFFTFTGGGREVLMEMSGYQLFLPFSHFHYGKDSKVSNLHSKIYSVTTILGTPA